MEAEKTAEPGPVTRQPHVMACYQNYLAHFQVKLSSLFKCLLAWKKKMLHFLFPWDKNSKNPKIFFIDCTHKLSGRHGPNQVEFAFEPIFHLDSRGTDH